MSDLDQRLLLAHAQGDAKELVALYLEAADQSADPEAEAFYLTHAHVFALELGDPRAEELRERLIATGRDVPLHPAPPPKR